MRKIPLGIAVALVLGSPNVFAAAQTYEGASKVGNHTDSEYSNFTNIQNAVNKNGEILDQVSKKTTELENQQIKNIEDIKQANSTANSAKEIATDAANNVKGATDAANAASNKADVAQKTAEDAAKDVKIADGKADAAQNKANEAYSQANTNKNDISALGGRVTSNEGKIAALQGSIGKGGEAYEMAVDNKAAIKQEVKDRIEGQKETLAASKAYTDSKYGELSAAIEKNRKESFAGIAAALAASQVPQVTQGSYFSLGAGAGSYQGQTAIAVGMSARFSDNLVSKLTVTADTQQRTGLGAGFAVEW